MIYLFTIFVGLVVVYVYRYYKFVNKYPKGPRPLPLIGNTRLMATGKDNDSFIQEMHKSYGPVFTIFTPEPIVYLTNYEAIKEGYLTKGDIFAGRPKSYPNRFFQFTENGGVIFSEGPVWQEQRRAALHILRDLGMGKNVMQQLVHHSIEDFLESVRNSNPEKGIDMRWHIQLFVGNVINKTLYGFLYKYDQADRMKSYADELNKFIQTVATDPIFHYFHQFSVVKKIPFLNYRVFGKYEILIKPLHNTVEEDIATALKNFDIDNDEPECLVQYYKQQMRTNPALSDEQLKSVCMDFYLAGMETTTTTLRWAVLFLCAFPDVQKKMRKEIAENIGFDRLVTLADKNNLPYCQAVIHEVQRRANIIPTAVVHKTLADTTIQDQPIPEGTSVFGQHAYLFDREEYFPEPEKFLPERFLMEDGKTLNKAVLDYLLPFSIGKRVCAGEGLARLELLIGLVTFVQKFTHLKECMASIRTTNSTLIFGQWTREQAVTYVSLAYVFISILMVLLWSMYLCIDGRRTPKRDTRVIHMLAQRTMFQRIT